jgi:hypothetical protein
MIEGLKPHAEYKNSGQNWLGWIAMTFQGRVITENRIRCHASRDQIGIDRRGLGGRAHRNRWIQAAPDSHDIASLLPSCQERLAGRVAHGAAMLQEVLELISREYRMLWEERLAHSGFLVVVDCR